MTEPSDLIIPILREIQAGQAEMRTALTDIGDGQTVVTQMVLRLERDMVRVKDLLGKLDARLLHLESVP